MIQAAWLRLFNPDIELAILLDDVGDRSTITDGELRSPDLSEDDAVAASYNRMWTDRRMTDRLRCYGRRFLASFFEHHYLYGLSTSPWPSATRVETTNSIGLARPRWTEIADEERW